MKKLTREEADQIVLLEGKSSKVRSAVMHLKVGEILQVDRADWKPINGPQQMCADLGKQTNKEFVVRSFANKQSWLIERTK